MCVCVRVFKDQGLGLGSVFKDLPILPAQVTPPALGLGNRGDMWEFLAFFKNRS